MRKFYEIQGDRHSDATERAPETRPGACVWSSFREVRMVGRLGCAGAAAYALQHLSLLPWALTGICRGTCPERTAHTPVARAASEFPAVELFFFFFSHITALPG